MQSLAPLGSSRLLEQLAGAADFEAAAGVLMHILTEGASTALQFLHGAEARVLRAMVHVRPDAQYNRAAALYASGAAIALYAPSATTWRWIAEHRCPVTVDVRLGTITLAEASGDRQHEHQPGSVWDTRRAWMSRAATHVVALPLLAGSEPIGMLTIEVEAGAAVGGELFGRSLLTDFDLLVARSTPFLLGLPLRKGEPADPLLPVVGKSMQATIQVLRLFAQQEDTLLLSGPTGAGKSRLAGWVHAHSPRTKGPFEVVHLATRPEGLRMGELFGWRRGAFSGATHDHVGALGRAAGGTIFLDEIDKLSLDDQAGLLRLLEDNRYRPLGDSRPEVEADVRFVLGTNVDLEARVRAGSFREDLYYRVHVLPVRVKGLDERRDEIGSWARFMLERRLRETTSSVRLSLAPEVELKLCERAWPGNLRQLDNVIRRAYALTVAQEIPGVLALATVERALAFESNAAIRSSMDALHTAANSIIDQAERGGPGWLDLDMVDGFRGLVLAIAAERLGSLEAAFRLFGRAASVQHRNHAKAFRKEVARLDALQQLLTGTLSGYTAGELAGADD